MKSLQLVVPFQTCPFKCPFCIANNPEVENAFENLYEKNWGVYIDTLAKILDNNRPRTVVITGDTEPTLNINWLRDVSKLVKVFSEFTQIELQTKNFNQEIISKFVNYTPINVYAFSVDTIQQLEKVKKLNVGDKIKRLTLLLNDRLPLDEIELGDSFDQVTIKYLQMGDNAKINEWIAQHQFKDQKSLNNFIKRCKDVSVMVDTNCMISENRYKIYRSDGVVYDTWTDLPQ